MVVEGAYTCVSALQLAKKAEIAVPITQAVYSIIYENLNPRDACGKHFFNAPSRRAFVIFGQKIVTSEEMQRIENGPLLQKTALPSS